MTATIGQPVTTAAKVSGAAHGYAGLTALLAPDRPDPQHDLTVAAQRLVSQTFFGQLLKQMRQSPFRSDLFEGGRGGQAFASLYDQHLAEHMTRGAGKKLVNSIVRRHLRAAAYRQPSASDPSTFQNARTHVAPGLRG